MEKLVGATDRGTVMLGLNLVELSIEEAVQVHKLLGEAIERAKQARRTRDLLRRPEEGRKA